ncbi:tapasin [Gadus morhua]|uniref:tapasin n=1 Tax=Gadus morhua TaxID=8049 RepID=UPI0011B3D25D|nr:tapasin-like [Gadus morhua]
MAHIGTLRTLVLIVMSCWIQAGSGGGCPPLECWFVREKPGEGLKHERTLLHVRTSPDSRSEETLAEPSSSSSSSSSDVVPDRVYHVTDGSASLLHPSLHPPQGSLVKPQCELHPFLPQPADVQWAASLTDSALSPAHLQADWLSATILGLDGGLALSTVARAATATIHPHVVLSVLTETVSVRCGLGEPVLLDCRFWADPSSPLSSGGFAVEWRYQFRGQGRLVLAYDGKTDRLAPGPQEGAALDFAGLHASGNASLVLQEAEARHSGTYVCAVHLPHLLAQVTVELEVVEPPSLSISPSPLPLAAPGQVLSVRCEASGFTPLPLELSWEFLGADGAPAALGEASLSGHREAWDGTYSQSSLLQLDTSALGRGGGLVCVARHRGGTRRSKVALEVIGFSTPSIQDSMAMVGMALLLYGIITLAFRNFAGSDGVRPKEKDQ